MRLARQAQGGFALVLVIWAIGLLALLIQTFLTTARFRLHASANIAAAARAEALAEVGMSLALMDLARSSAGARQTTRIGPVPLLCAAPGGLIAVSIEGENGKIDLNAAPPDLLRRLLTGVGASPTQTANIVAAIVDFRTEGAFSPFERDYQLDGRPFGPRKGAFQSVQELDQVLGVSPQLYARLKPHVTIYGAAGGLEPDAATQQLRALLGLGRNDPQSPLSSGHGAAYAIHVESLTTEGGRFTREAIIGSGTPGRTLWSVREWRVERARWETLLLGAQVATLPPC